MDGDGAEGPKDGGPKTDLLLVTGAAESGAGLQVVRTHDEVIEVGELCPLEEGKPIHGEVVKLTPRKEHARLFDVEVLVPRPKKEVARPKLGHAGPARVSTESYRDNWEQVFGQRKPALPN